MTISDGRPPAQSGPEATEDLTLPLDGGSIHVSQDGPRDAPALLLIHGSGASTRSWNPLVPLLTESHRVIRIDLLGYGRSDKPDDGDYAIPTQARRAGMVLDRLGVTNATVVGHSSGGLTATALAEQRPDMVTALALINTGPRTEALIAQRFSFEPAQWAQLTDEQLRQATSTAFSRPGYRPPQELIDDIRLMTFHTFAATMQASGAYLAEQPVPDRLKGLSWPLLVIFGADDRRWRSSFAADYHVVPGAQVEMLPGIGHSPILEDPPRAAEPLLAFTARHVARP